MAVKSRIPKAARKAAEQGVAPGININLSVETLQLSHEALVQMRAPNSQVTLAKARAMSELEGLLAAFGAQQQAQQQQAAAAAQDVAAAAPETPAAPAPAPAKRKGKR